MNTRIYFALGLVHAQKVMRGLTTDETPKPTQVEIDNAVKYLVGAAEFLRKEQAAIDLLTEHDRD